MVHDHNIVEGSRCVVGINGNYKLMIVKRHGYKIIDFDNFFQLTCFKF